MHLIDLFFFGSVNVDAFFFRRNL